MKKQEIDNTQTKVGTNSVAGNGMRNAIPGGFVKMNNLKNPFPCESGSKDFHCEAGNSDFHCEAGSNLPDDLPPDYCPQDNGEWINGDQFNKMFNENLQKKYSENQKLNEPLDTPKPEQTHDGLNYGWICPKCGSVLAPWVRECPHCGNHSGRQIDIRFQKPLYDFNHQYRPEYQPTTGDPLVREPSTAEPLFEQTTTTTNKL